MVGPLENTSAAEAGVDVGPVLHEERGNIGESFLYGLDKETAVVVAATVSDHIRDLKFSRDPPSCYCRIDPDLGVWICAMLEEQRDTV